MTKKKIASMISGVIAVGVSIILWDKDPAIAVPLFLAGFGALGIPISFSAGEKKGERRAELKKAHIKKMMAAILVAGFLAVGAFSPQHVIALNWKVANQFTVDWNPVTNLKDGTPLPETSTVQYRCYLANAITDPDKANPSEVGVATEANYTVTLNVEGQYYFGVRSERMEDLGNGPEVVSVSTISWSDDSNVVENGQTWGLRHFFPPAMPSGL